jgi:signal transduction histidine kinase
MVRILIVEDKAPVVADLTRMLSKRDDICILIATNVTEALQQIAGSQIDLVLMDMKLPPTFTDIQTVELLQRRIDIPIIYLTTNSGPETNERDLTNYHGGYLVKPIASQQLETVIETALMQFEIEQKFQDSENQLRLLYKAEHESRQMAEILVETSQVLASSLDVNIVLDRILEQVSRIVDNDVCNIMLIEGDGTLTVRSRGYETFDAETFIETFVFPLSGLPVRQHIIDTGQPVVVPDVRTDPLWSLPTGAAWLRSYVAAPIYLGDQVIGFINVGNSRAGFYNLSHAGRLQAFGHQAALAFQNARLYEETRINAGHLQVLSRRLLNVQEFERRAIARELHDEIGQALTAAKINLQSLQRHPEASSLQAGLKDCSDIINLALQQVRSLSLDLHPAVLDDLGLLPAVRWFVDRESQRCEFKAQVKAQNLPDRLSPEIELACFRVVQEALTNISRHARAKNVTVEFWQTGSDLHVLIHDDGVGFEKEGALQKVMKSGSLGLLSMQERIALVHGHFDIDSTPGQGTEIHARIPLEVA